MKKGIKLLVTVFVILSTFMFVNAKSYKCEVVDGAYYGKDGTEVDKVQYETECASHTCEIVGDTYFGKGGNTVDQVTFENECGTTVVTELPDTSSSKELIYIIIGGVLVLGTVVFSISYRKVSDN